jgi:hypothetical protein
VGGFALANLTTTIKRQSDEAEAERCSARDSGSSDSCCGIGCGSSDSCCGIGGSGRLGLRPRGLGCALTRSGQSQGRTLQRAVVLGRMLLRRQSRGRSLQRAAARSRMELSPTRLALGLCCFVGDGGGRRRLTVDGRRSTADARDNVMTKTKTAKAATTVEGGGRRGGSDYHHPLYPCYLSDRDVGRLVVVDGDGAALSWWVGDG